MLYDCFRLRQVSFENREGSNGIRYHKETREVVMSSIVYVVPWAICDTESIYIKKTDAALVPAPEKGAEINEWCIRNVLPSPDGRSKDIYAVVDVYNGYKEKMNEKGMSVFSLSNSAERLEELGFTRADEKESYFIRTKVLKLKNAGKRK